MLSISLLDVEWVIVFVFVFLCGSLADVVEIDESYGEVNVIFRLEFQCEAGWICGHVGMEGEGFQLW